MDRDPLYCTGSSEQSQPKAKEKQEGKGVVSRGFQIPKERREAKTKGERERYIQLNTKFQTRVQREKKAFINEQCIKQEGNKRRRRNRYLFMKIGDIKGSFSSQMGTIKDSNDGDLVDAEEIKKMERIHR